MTRVVQIIVGAILIIVLVLWCFFLVLWCFFPRTLISPEELARLRLIERERCENQARGPSATEEIVSKLTPVVVAVTQPIKHDIEEYSKASANVVKVELKEEVGCLNAKVNDLAEKVAKVENQAADHEVRLAHAEKGIADHEVRLGNVEKTISILQKDVEKVMKNFRRACAVPNSQVKDPNFISPRGSQRTVRGVAERYRDLLEIRRDRSTFVYRRSPESQRPQMEREIVRLKNENPDIEQIVFSYCSYTDTGAEANLIIEFRSFNGTLREPIVLPAHCVFPLEDGSFAFRTGKDVYIVPRGDATYRPHS